MRDIPRLVLGYVLGVALGAILVAVGVTICSVMLLCGKL